MLEDPQLWRQDLLRKGLTLRSRYNQKRWTRRTLFAIEKEVFLSAYIIRKLLDQDAVSARVSNRKVNLFEYPINEHDIPTDLHVVLRYNVLGGTKTRLSVREICNQFIHSKIFAPFVPFDSNLVGFYFCSDFRFDSKIYYLTLVRMIETIESVGKNHVVSLSVNWNKQEKRYIVTENL